MKLLLDSANLAEIKRFMETWAIAGVTTNPSLMAKEEKGDYLERIDEIVQTVARQSDCKKPRHLSVEVTTLDSKEMIEQALQLQEHKTSNISFFIKIPCTYLNVITELAYRGMNINATACMTSFQGKLAADAGAKIVSFFYNRIKDEIPDPYKGAEYESDPKIVLDEFNLVRPVGTRVICGSIRKKSDVLNSWLHGADYVTASSKIIEEMLKHPQTDKAIRQFQEDIDRWRS